VEIPKSVQIGSLTIAPATFLAPIAEITDSPFRKIVRGFGGIGAVFSEMIPSDAYTRNIERTDFMARFSPEERPIFFQIVGRDPERMAMAAEMAQEAGADALDINMGCPSSTITRHGSGSALLRNPELAQQIVRAVRRVTRIPMTVKIRSGWDLSSLNYRDIGAMAQDCGVDAVFFHGRTKKQMYRDSVHLDHIADLKSRLTIPVIGNGDIVDRDSLDRMLGTGCDGIMIARAAIKRPWIFAELAGLPPAGPETLLHHATVQFQECLDTYPERLALHKMKVFIGWYSRSLPGGKHLRMQLTEVHDTETAMNLLAQYAESHGFHLPDPGFRPTL